MKQDPKILDNPDNNNSRVEHEYYLSRNKIVLKGFFAWIFLSALGVWSLIGIIKLIFWAQELGLISFIK